MVLYNLYLVLINERIKVYDNTIHAIVFEGLSDDIPDELMNKLVHDITIVSEKNIDRAYFLIKIN